MMMAKAFRGGNDRDYLLDNVLDPPTGPCPQDTGEGTSSCPAGSAAEQTPDEEPEVPEGAAGSNPAVHTYVASCVAALGGFLFGYDIGIISGAKAQMQRDLELTSSDLEWVVSILPAGALIASLTGGSLVDKLGRKSTIMANSVVFAVGALLVSFAEHFGTLMLGRLVLGYAMSLSITAECIYISEISTPRHRGRLVGLNELCITIGILVSYLANFCLADVRGGWRVMSGICSIVAIVQCLAMIPLPRTPHFLLIKGREDEAKRIIRKLNLAGALGPSEDGEDRGGGDVQKAVDRIKESIADSLRAEEAGLASMFKCHGIRFVIAFGLMFFQQFTGQPNLMYYAADVFRSIGFHSETGSILASVGLGSAKVLSTVASLNVIDRLGRRKTLLGGVAAMGVSVLALGILAIYDDTSLTSAATSGTCSSGANSSRIANSTATTDQAAGCLEHSNGTFSTWFKFVGFLCLATYVCAFSFSFGPISWLVLSEIFPASIRGRAMSLATSVNWLSNVVVSATFFKAQSLMTTGGVFIVYAFLCTVALAFIGWFVPETKDRSLEDISKHLTAKRTTQVYYVDGGALPMTSTRRSGDVVMMVNTSSHI